MQALRFFLLAVILAMCFYSVTYVRKYTAMQQGFSINKTTEVVNATFSVFTDIKGSNKLLVDEGKIQSVQQSSLNTFDPLSLDVPLPFLPDYKNPCFRNEESKLYCLPYFFLLVSQKSGSTDLFYTLTSHPKIIRDKKKEYHWWNRGRFPLRIKNWNNMTFSDYMDWYNSTTNRIETSVMEANISNAYGGYHPNILGDFTASYLYDQLQWKRYPQNAGLLQPKVISAHTIHHILPSAKFIVILRDPSQRTFSDYCYYNGRKQSERVFHTNVKAGIEWFNSCLTHGNGSCLYDVPEYIPTTTGWHPDLTWDPVVRLRASLYSEFLADWFKVFDRKQFYIFRFEDYITDRLHYVNEISEFLGLEKMFYLRNTPPQRQTRHKMKFQKGTKKLLDEFYKPFNIKLARMLNDERYLWNSFED